MLKDQGAAPENSDFRYGSDHVIQAPSGWRWWVGRLSRAGGLCAVAQPRRCISQSDTRDHVLSLSSLPWACALEPLVGVWQVIEALRVCIYFTELLKILPFCNAKIYTFSYTMPAGAAIPGI